MRYSCRSVTAKRVEPPVDGSMATGSSWDNGDVAAVGGVEGLGGTAASPAASDTEKAVQFCDIIAVPPIVGGTPDGWGRRANPQQSV